MGHPVPPDDPTPWGDDCAQCVAGETPEFLTVDFTGLIPCTNCIYGGGGAADCYKWLCDVAKLNTTSFLLTQDQPCRWSMIDNSDFGDRQGWNCNLALKTCSSLIWSIPITGLTIIIRKTGPTAIIVTAGLFIAGVFFGFTGDVSGVLSDCMNISNIDNDFGLVCADWDGPGVLNCRGGSMRIRQGNWT